MRVAARSATLQLMQLMRTAARSATPQLIRLSLGVLLLLRAGGVMAQHTLATHGAYDPNVPAPHTVLGYQVGDHFTMHHVLMRYLDRLAATSPRIRLDTVGHTFEGREVMMVIATSEANQQRLEQIRMDAQRIADPRGTAPAELDAVVARMPAVVWLGYSVHGPEASGVEAAIALLYQLAAGRDPQTLMILDSTVVLIDPVQNPDGHERHAQDVRRMLPGTGVPEHASAMIHSGTWPGPRTSHYYFDLNRDWYAQSHPETRARVASMLRWWPHVAVDLHEMGSSSTYFFPPAMDPINQLVHPEILRWWDVYADAIIGAFDVHGWSFFRREGYDEFYPGYGSSWPLYTGAVGMTFEQASSRGGAIRRSDGTVLTLRQAASGHYTAAWATTLATAQRRSERVRDYLAYRRSSISESVGAPVRAIVIERDAQGRADSLARKLLHNGIEVGRLRAATDVRNATSHGSTQSAAARFAAGAYVVDLAQPQGRLARALLEPDAPLDSTFIAEELERRRTGLGNRFYDATAWSLPFTFRVRAWGTPAAVGPVDDVTEALLDGMSPAPPAEARYGYAFAPGSEAALRLLAALLADSVRVWYAPRPFRSGSHEFASGAFIVRAAANATDVHERVRRHAAAAGALVAPLASARADAGTDLGSNSVFPLRAPRVALLGGAPVSGSSFGYAWYAFDQRLGYAVTALDASAVAGAALDDFNVLIVPSVSSGALDGALGESGRNRVAGWVRAGGVLITLDAATEWLATERTGLARLRVRRDSVRADSVGGAPLPGGIPGAIVRAVGDTLSPLLAGMRPAEFPVLLFSGRVLTPPRDLRAGEVVLRYASQDRLRLAGYMWPEAPARVAESVYLWTERAGRGRVIGFAGEPNFRDLWRGLLPLFANAVFLGGSF